jgi:hypothetical protein
MWLSTPDSASAWQIAIVRSFHHKQEQQHFSGQSTDNPLQRNLSVDLKVLRYTSHKHNMFALIMAMPVL